MGHIVHKLAGGIKIQQYNNGSYGYFLEGKGWRNIPKQLGKDLVEELSVSPVNIVLPSMVDVVDEASFRHSDGERHSSFISGAIWIRALARILNNQDPST